MRSRASPKNPSKAEQDKRDNITSIVFLAIVVIGVLFVILNKTGAFDGLVRRGDIKIDLQTGEVIEGLREFPDTEPSVSVEIPGYKLIELKANTVQQDTLLENPAGNRSYFKLSLILADGTVIWQSDYLEPGAAFAHIELNQKLKKGTYEHATLRYEVYSLAGFGQENGSDIKLTLDVR